jgi:hypothetical protein
MQALVNAFYMTLAPKHSTLGTHVAAEPVRRVVHARAETARKAVRHFSYWCTSRNFRSISLLRYLRGKLAARLEDRACPVI